MASAVVFDAFSFSYSRELPSALDRISLSLPPGTCCAVLGPSGSGKSTLLMALTGVLKKHHPLSSAKGSTIIGGESYNPLPSKSLYPRVAMAIQDPRLQISGLCSTVEEEILLSVEGLDMSEEEKRVRLFQSAARLEIGHLLSRDVQLLSGGEAQRVALATALIASPEILLLDEPFAQIDPAGVASLIRLIRSLQSRTTIIFTDSGVEPALVAADLICVLDAGKTRFLGPRQKFFRELPHFSETLPVELLRQARDHLLQGVKKREKIALRLRKILDVE